MARFERLQAWVARYHCVPCRLQCRPLLDVLGVEPGTQQWFVRLQRNAALMLFRAGF